MSVFANKISSVEYFYRKTIDINVDLVVDDLKVFFLRLLFHLLYSVHCKCTVVFLSCLIHVLYIV